MTSVFLLLSLPQTSNGFTEFRPTVIETSIDDGLASPPRKVARLADDSDSASASRSKSSSIAGKPVGPIQIQVVGNYENKPAAGDKQLALLRRCIRTILTRMPGPDDTMPTTYEGIYNACRSIITVANLGDDLYNILRIELEQSIGRLSRALTDSTEKDMAWITSFTKALAWFERQIDLLKSLLTYVDQVYVIQTKNITHVSDLAYRLISDRIFGHSQIVERYRNGVKEWLNSERKNPGDPYQERIIPTLVEHLLRHKQYSAFEEYYISITREFYVAESEEQAELLKDRPKKFFTHARNRIDAEVRRSLDVLPFEAYILVREVTEKALWSGKAEWLADSTLASYMHDEDFETLHAMYTLFARVGATDYMLAAFRNHVRVTVAKIVNDADRDDEMVQRLLDFKALADKAISFIYPPPISPDVNPTLPTASTSQLSPPLPDKEFIYALTDAFSIGFKARRNKPAEMIAKYLDKVMRKGQGANSDAHFQAILDGALGLYRFTDDKDVFRTFYHRALAKRLLLEKTASDDFEKRILKKLKENYDPDFGMGEDMFKDLALSRDSMRDYHARLPEDSPGHDLTAMVLQRSAWPFAAQQHVVDLPPNMQDQLTAYSDYYKSKHSGRVLDWNHSLGTATLKARFKAGVKELSVSLYQAVVLLLFNDHEADGIPFLDIKEQTSIDDAELRRTLQSLACGKKKILKKLPVGRDVDDSDIFKFNPDFDDPRAKVHINSIQAKVSPEESKRTNRSIEDDRKFTLDAAIVRIMKARKEMNYEHLKAATIDAVKSHFVPQVDMIKRRIDALVETEYLERSSTDKNTYMYVA
ncbi:Cullin family-domain-containing protein [Crassisporium funariophilum]|nr:Cullin family-domain-containing protein [Crassisporium funariophilum]